MLPNKNHFIVSEETEVNMATLCSTYIQKTHHIRFIYGIHANEQYTD